MSLTRMAYSGARWTAISSAMVTAVQFLQTLFLARILSPEDFGLVAIVLIVFNFVQIFADMGISGAVVHRQDTTEDHLSSLFWLNLFAGGAVFLATVVMSPIVVAIYGEPRLAPLIHYAALIFLIWPIGGLFGLLLQKELRFAPLALCEISAALLGAAVTILTALQGFGASSLIWGKLAGAVLTAAVFGLIGWRRWRPSLHFSLPDLKGYLSFGLFQMGQSTLLFLSSQIDQLYVGIVLGPEPLGYYAFAWNLVLQPMMKLNYILTRVAFPLFAKVQLNEERLQRGYLTLVWTLVSIDAPILIGCAATAPLLVPLVFGAKWIPAVIIVQTLAFVSLIASMMIPVDSVVLAKGRTDLGFVWRSVLLFPEVVSIYLGGTLGGLFGVALAKLCFTTVCWVAQYFVVLRVLIGPCLAAYISSVFPPLAIGGIMGAAVWSWPEMLIATPVLSLACDVALGIAIYVVLSVLLQRSRIHQMKELLSVK